MKKAAASHGFPIPGDDDDEEEDDDYYEEEEEEEDGEEGTCNCPNCRRRVEEVTEEEAMRIKEEK